MMKSIYLLSFIALLSGVVLPIQAVLNAKLGKTVGDPIYGALISFIIGGLGLGLLLGSEYSGNYSTLAGAALVVISIASLIILTVIGSKK